jgi:imidazole glycerol-phosphate synthase subunit HisF
MSKLLYLPEMREIRKKLRHNTTNAEKFLWRYIRDKQLQVKFLRQVSIGRFVVDFYCKEIGLAIELDGSIHDKKEIKERDKIRQAIIESDNVHFLRFTNEEVFNDTDVVLLKIQKACAELSQ